MINALALLKEYQAADQARETGGIRNDLMRFQLAQGPIESNRKNALMQQAQQQRAFENRLAMEQAQLQGRRFGLSERAQKSTEDFQNRGLQLREKQLGMSKIPPGYRMTPMGLEPIPGGPADPAVAEAHATRKKRGEMAMALPDLIAEAEMGIKQIDEMIGDESGTIREHPGFQNAVGMPNMLGLGARVLPIPATSTADFKRRLDQVLGGAFMQAYKTLKGGGQITEVEGKKATAAIARMDQSQSEKEFKAAAREFQGIIRRAVENAKAQVAPSAPSSSANNDPLGLRK